MKNLIGLLVFTSLMLPVCAAPQATKQHVPTNVNGLRLIDKTAASFNHIAIVNVGNAIPAADWSLSVTYAASRFELNVATNSLDKSIAADIIKDDSTIGKVLGVKAKIAVFIEDTDAPYPYLSAPGVWCRVNVRPLKADHPDAQTLRDRYAKAILRGCVYACGAGASLDGRSAMYFDAADLKGMDKTGITIAPDSYFPMQGYLHRIGGDEIVSPSGAVEE